MGFLKWLWNVINDYSGILQILLTIAGFLTITRNQLRDERFATRLNDMKKTMEAISTDRNLYMEAALDLYRKRYRDREDCQDFVRSGHLIYRNGWVNNRDSKGRLFPLKSFTPAIVATYPDPQENIPYNPLLPDRRESYAENCKFHLGKNLFDAPLYALKSVELRPGEQPVITVTQGSYFNFYNTCEYLNFEMAYARRILGKKQKSRRTLPCRYRRRELFDTDNRFPGIGINTLTILTHVTDDDPNGKGNMRSFFLLHKRGNKVAEGMGNYHVVPAGSYQPLREYFTREETDSDHVAETMKNTVLREFGEELLNYEEFLDLNTSDLLQELDRRLEPLYLGIGFEPLNTKTEVLAVLVLDMAKPEVAALLGGHTKRSSLSELFGGGKNYEGDIFLRPLTTAMLRQYENDSRSTASMKEIMRLMQLEENQKQFGVEQSVKYQYHDTI